MSIGQFLSQLLFFCSGRLMTGSFDKTVKIWSIDGKFTHKLDNFLATISGICYVPRNKTVWVAGGTSYASLFDPKSGDNVRDMETYGFYFL
jgi:WD40 repeat protein